MFREGIRDGGSCATVRWCFMQRASHVCLQVSRFGRFQRVAVGFCRANPESIPTSMPQLGGKRHSAQAMTTGEDF